MRRKSESDKEKERETEFRVMESWLTVRKAVPRPRTAPRGSVSREVSLVSRAWERGAPGCW